MKKKQKHELVNAVGEKVYSYSMRSEKLGFLKGTKCGDLKENEYKKIMYFPKRIKYKKSALRGFSNNELKHATGCFVESSGICKTPTAWIQVLILSLFANISDVMAKEYDILLPSILIEDIDIVPDTLCVLLDIFAADEQMSGSKWMSEQPSICKPSIDPCGLGISLSPANYSKAVIYYKKAQVSIPLPYSCCAFAITKNVPTSVAKELVEGSPLALPILFGKNSATKKARDTQISISGNELLEFDMDMFENLSQYTEHLKVLVQVFARKFCKKERIQESMRKNKLQFTSTQKMGRFQVINSNEEFLLWVNALAVFQCFLDFLIAEQLLESSAAKLCLMEFWRAVLPETGPKNADLKSAVTIESPKLFMEFLITYVAENQQKIQRINQHWQGDFVGAIRELRNSSEGAFLILQRESLFETYRTYILGKEGDISFCKKSGKAWHTRLQRELCDNFTFIKRDDRDVTWNYKLAERPICCIAMPLSYVPEIADILKFSAGEIFQVITSAKA